MSAVEPDTTGLDAIRNQAEFSLQLWQYLNRATSDWKVAAGKAKAKEYAPLFARIEKDFGVETVVHARRVGHRVGVRRPGGREKSHAPGDPVAGDTRLGRTAPPRLLGAGADQRAVDRAKWLEHAGRR